MTNRSEEELEAFGKKLYNIMESPPSLDYVPEIDIVRFSDTEDEMGFEAFNAKYDTREKVLAEFGYKNQS